MFVVLIGTEVLTIALAASIVKAQKNMPIHSEGDNVADEADASFRTKNGERRKSSSARLNWQKKRAKFGSILTFQPRP